MFAHAYWWKDYSEDYSKMYIVTISWLLIFMLEAAFVVQIIVFSWDKSLISQRISGAAFWNEWQAKKFNPICTMANENSVIAKSIMAC